MLAIAITGVLAGVVAGVLAGVVAVFIVRPVQGYRTPLRGPAWSTPPGLPVGDQAVPYRVTKRWVRRPKSGPLARCCRRAPAWNGVASRCGATRHRRRPRRAVSAPPSFAPAGRRNYAVTVGCTRTPSSGTFSDGATTLAFCTLVANACNAPSNGACPASGTPAVTCVRRQLSWTVAR